jgi:hypothetical protein
MRSFPSQDSLPVAMLAVSITATTFACDRSRALPAVIFTS